MSIVNHNLAGSWVVCLGLRSLVDNLNCVAIQDQPCGILLDVFPGQPFPLEERYGITESELKRDMIIRERYDKTSWRWQRYMTMSHHGIKIRRLRGKAPSFFIYPINIDSVLTLVSLDNLEHFYLNSQCSSTIPLHVTRHMINVHKYLTLPSWHYEEVIQKHKGQNSFPIKMNNEIFLNNKSKVL